MSKPTRWSLVCAVSVAACGFVFACATGGSRGGGGDDVVEINDAPITTQKDANVSTMSDGPKMDSSIVIPDAAAPQPDAPPGSLLCTSNSQCTTAGECCFAINGQGFCVPGTILLGQCFPIN
jgi:hypothetical protein